MDKPHESAAGTGRPDDRAGFPHDPPRLPLESCVHVDVGQLWVGSRPFPWARLYCDTAELPEPLGSWHVRRARIMFENGWSVSIAWGSGTYSTNYEFGLVPPAGDAVFTETPRFVEVAIIGRDDSVIGPPGADDEVAAYRTVADVLAIIDGVATWPSGEMPGVPAGWNQ